MGAGAVMARMGMGRCGGGRKVSFLLQIDNVFAVWYNQTIEMIPKNAKCKLSVNSSLKKEGI